MDSLDSSTVSSLYNSEDDAATTSFSLSDLDMSLEVDEETDTSGRLSDSLTESLANSSCSSSDTHPEDTEDLCSDIHQPLYDGSKLTTFESHLVILKYGLRHGLTKLALSDLLNLVGMHLPKTCMVSLYRLKKFFLNLYEDISFCKHHCCSVCHAPVDDAESTCVNGCSGSAVEFLTISLESQLRRKLEDPAIWSHLQSRFERGQDSDIRDVLDGDEYRKHGSFLSEPGNVTLLLNTDGVSVFKSSTISLWPIWLAINELPPHIRFLKRNLLLAGLWYSNVKPTMTTFLGPFMKEINHLDDHGFQVITPAGDTISARARLLMCSLDLPAKAIVLNAKQFNGRHGCSYCEDEGVPRASTHLHRNWLYSTNCTARTHSGIVTNAREALRNGAPEMGVKGASALVAHKPFNLSVGAVIDVMHCVFLGVVAKTLMGFWLDVAHRSNAFSNRRKVKECDERMAKIKVPHDFNRAVKGLTNVKHWKASEYRSWLLYFSLPVLQGILPDPFFSHYSLLVAATHILLSECISQSALRCAEQYLHRFYGMFANLYGENGCTMNVHLLRHLPECVRNWGPLWAYSCFPFESMNGHLKTHFHGTRCMNAQLAFSYVMLQVLPKCAMELSKTNILALSDCQVLGSVRAIYVDPQVRQYLAHNFRIESTAASAFDRAVISGKTFYSRSYTRIRKRNSYTICYSESGKDMLGFINYFISLPSSSVAVVTPLTPNSSYCYPQQLHVLRQCIIPVSVESSVVVVPTKCILYKCVCIQFCGATFVAKLPNQLYGD